MKIIQENVEMVWIQEARNGCKESFGQLVEAYQRPVYSVAYRLLGNSGEAEEAAQEAFIRAYTRLDRYDINRKFSTWLLTITSNYCIDLLRKRRALLLSIDDKLPAHPALRSDHRSCPENSAVKREASDSIQSLLDTLPVQYRQAIVLRYWQQLSYDEIALQQQSSVSAVKSRLFRAKRMLAQEISAENSPFGAIFAQSASTPQLFFA